MTSLPGAFPAARASAGSSPTQIAIAASAHATNEQILLAIVITPTALLASPKPSGHVYA